MPQTAIAPLVVLGLDIPKPLHARAKAVAKRHHRSMTRLVRDGLEQQCNELEAKEREEEDRKRAERNGKRGIGRQVTGLDQQGDVSVLGDSIPDRLSSIFDEHARLIAEALAHPAELEKRRKDAIAAIKRMAPLSYANESKIVKRLEYLISEMDLPSVTIAQSPTLPTPIGPSLPTAMEIADLIAPLKRIIESPVTPSTAAAEHETAGKKIAPRKHVVVKDE